MSLVAPPSVDPFVALSHELRTPLTCIDGYIGLLLEDETAGLDEHSRECLDIIERNGQRLMHTVRNLRFLADLDAGTLAWQRTSVDLHTLAVQAVQAARPTASMRGIELELTGGHPQLVCVGDPERLAHALDNLLLNALRFTSEGGRAELRLAGGPHHATIEVHDDGAGIEEESSPHVLARYFRSPGAVDRGVQGMGLGLTVVDAIVSRHEGTIEITSQLDAGTAARVHLPLAEGRAGSARSGRPH